MKYKYYYIYKITVTEGSLSGSYYFGQHKTNNLTDGYKGSGTILKRYYKKYPKSYNIEILSFYNSQEELDQAEYDIINQYLNDDKCLNICFGGKSGGGHKQSDETKQKISETMKGRPAHNKGIPASDITKQKISVKSKGHSGYMLGKHQTESTKQKISNANKGRQTSDETKKKISEALKGKKKSEEHIIHMSEALKGRVSPNKGKKFSEEHRRKLSEAHKKHESNFKGKHHTEESKNKMSESHKGQIPWNKINPSSIEIETA